MNHLQRQRLRRSAWTPNLPPYVGAPGDVPGGVPGYGAQGDPTAPEGPSGRATGVIPVASETSPPLALLALAGLAAVALYLQVSKRPFGVRRAA